MKTMLRMLLVSLALVLCLVPVLASCDSNGGDSDKFPEGRKVVSFNSQDKNYKVALHQLEETNGQDSVPCSIILYKADGTPVDAATFDLKCNGQDVALSWFKQANWHDDHCEIVVADADGTQYTYKLSYQP